MSKSTLVILAGSVAIAVIAFLLHKTRRRRVLKIHVKIGADHFDVEGKVTLDHIKPFLERWYSAREQSIGAELEKITQQVKITNDGLEDAIDPTNPK